MHVGRARDLRGPAALARRVRRAHRVAPAPGAALPPEAGRPALRDGPPVLGRRPELQPRLPRAPHRAAAARAPTTSCASSPGASSPSASTARSRSGSSGWSRGSRAASFAVISKTHHALVDGVAGVDIATVLFDLQPVPPEVAEQDEWIPAPDAVGRRTWWPRGSRGSCARRSRWPAARSGALGSPGRSLEQAREAAEGIGEVVWARDEPGARRAAQRADRPAPARVVGAEPPERLQGDQGRARRHRQRRGARGGGRRARAAGCARAACAPRASSCARSCRSRSAREDEHGALGNRIAAMRGPLPVYVDGPGRAPAAGAARRWATSRSRSRRSAPR